MNFVSLSQPSFNCFHWTTTRDQVASITMGECRRGGKAAECVEWGVKFPRFLWLFMVLSSLDKERAFSLLAPLIPDLGSLHFLERGRDMTKSLTLNSHFHPMVCTALFFIKNHWFGVKWFPYDRSNSQTRPGQLKSYILAIHVFEMIVSTWSQVSEIKFYNQGK